MRTRKRYLITRSPLYKLHSKKRLCALLGVEISELRRATRSSSGYKVFDIAQGLKKRTIEKPQGAIEVAHESLFKLLSRLETPDYLHSGVKKDHI